MTKYDIDFLIVKFEEHHKKSLEHHEKQMKKFKENFPDIPLPDYIIDDFSVTLALKNMCEEIKALKDG